MPFAPPPADGPSVRRGAWTVEEIIVANGDGYEWRSPTTPIICTMLTPNDATYVPPSPKKSSLSMGDQDSEAKVETNLNS